MAGFAIPATPPVTQITDFAGSPNRVLYLNAAGAVTELPLGAAGTVLTSQGPSAAPAFGAPGSPVALILALGG